MAATPRRNRVVGQDCWRAKSPERWPNRKGQTENPVRRLLR